MNVDEVIKVLSQFVIDRASNLGIFDSDISDNNEEFKSEYSKEDYENLKDYLTSSKSSKFIAKGIAYTLTEHYCFIDNEHISDVVNQTADEIERLFKVVNKSVNSNNSNNSKKTLAKRAMETIVKDSSEVAIRLSARQLTKTVQEPLVNLLVQGLQLEQSDSVRSKVSSFLNTEIGFGVISLLCSFAVGSLPIPGASKIILNRLSEELRVQGGMSVSEPVIDLLMAPMRSLLTEKVLSLPIPGLVPQQLESQTSIPISFNSSDNEIKVVEKPKKKIIKKKVSS